MKKIIEKLLDHNTPMDNDTRREIAGVMDEMSEIVKAVAHIDIDWGYGKFELDELHIDAARKLYEESI